MVNNYNDADAQEEAELLQPEPSPTLTGLEQGEKSLTYIKGTIARIISADPDVFFDALGILAKRIVALANTAERCISEINVRLPSSNGPDTVLNEPLLFELLTEIANMRSGSYQERANKLKILKIKNERLVQSLRYVGPSSTGSGKDGSETRQELFAYLARLVDNYTKMLALCIRFKEAHRSYLSSRLYGFAVDAQVDAIIARTSLFLGNSGASVSRATLVSTVGISLLDERMTLRNWRSDKYAGNITVYDGIAAYAISTKSLPVAPTGAVVDALDVDGVTGTLNISSGTVPRAVVPLERYYDAGTGVGDRYSPSWPLVASDVTLRVLRDNTVLTVTLPGVAWTSTAQMRASLDAALTPLGISVSSTGDTLTFTRVDASGYGSRARIAFFDTSGGANDLNAVFRLTSSLGEFRGDDTYLSGVTASGFAGAPNITSELSRVYSGSGVPGVSGGASKFTVDTGHDIQVGDSLRIGDSYYHVVVVTATEITLDVEVLYEFDGATVDASKELSFEVLRERVTVTSPSTVYGTTAIDFGTGNYLAFPDVANSPEGAHQVFSLDDSIDLGVIIRTGDYLLGTDGKVFGSIASIRDNQLIAVLSQSTFPSAYLRIKARGEYYYSVILGNITTIDEKISDAIEIDEFVSRVNLYVSSGQNLGLATDALANILEICTLTRETFEQFDANSTTSLQRLFSYLRENRMTAVYELMRECAFYEISQLTVDDLSDIGAIRYYSGVLGTDLGIDEEIMVLSPGAAGDDTYTRGENLKGSEIRMSPLSRGE